MRSLFSVSLAFGLLASVAAVGCAAPSDAADDSESAAADLTAVPCKVDAVASSLGVIFANRDGFSLYTFDNDTTSDSTCYNQCAQRWPALTVTSTYGIRAPFGTSTRTDGKKQLTLNGHPLYTFANDLAAGDVNGEGIGGVWHLARPEAAHVSTPSATVGKIYANGLNMSLYTFDNDTTSDSTCYNQCAERWPALIVPSDRGIAAPFGISVRTDGKKQVTLNGKPLYTFANDTKPNDVNGDGIGGVWHLARPAAPPAPPPPSY